MFKKFLIFLSFLILSFNVLGATNKKLVKNNNDKTFPIQFMPLKGTHNFIYANKKKYDFEVLYFFSYACPHCYQFEPYMKLWEKKGIPNDVKVVMIPVQFRKDWIESAKAFEVGRELGIEKKVTNKIFDYMHKEKHDMFTKKDLMNFFINVMKVKKDDFERAYNSFTLNYELQKYKKIVNNYDIQGTPTLVLITKKGSAFLTDPELAKSPVNMITSMDFIINKLRPSYLNKNKK